MGFWSEIFAPGEAARSDRLDAALREQNRRLVARGLMTPEQYDTFEERLADTSSGNYDELIEEAFVEGAQEGLQRQQEAVKNTLTGTLKGALGFVPWWAWLLGLGFVLYQSGAFVWVRKKITS